MKQVILDISDSNMARQEWRWRFYLEGKRGEAYTLSCRQFIAGEEPLTLDPVGSLRDGVDVYEALESLMSEAGCSLQELDLIKISDKIAKLDQTFAEQFRRGQQLSEERDDARREIADRERKEALRAYRKSIDDYVLRFSDAPSRYGAQRGWAKRFIEEYVISNGRLPTGVHQITVAGYSGGSHDFGDFST